MARTMMYLLMCLVSLGCFYGVSEAWNMRDMSIKTMMMINNPQYSNYLMAKYRQQSSWTLCRYGGYRVDCCLGWIKESNGLCTPVCDNGCKHGTCVAPNRCQCDKGWTGERCDRDYNECRDKPCHHRCMNSQGSYKCYCLRGYALSIDKKTCSLDYRCHSERCSFGCEEIENDKFQCFCPEGMRPAGDGFNCLDVDECAEGLVTCPSDQQCVNTYGNWMCMCKEGFAFSMVNGRLQCKERNQCEDLGLKCHTNARCVETPAGFKCICSDGYVGDGSTCIPIDPRRCSDRPCFQSVECFNVPLNVDTIDFENTQIVKLFKCGPCPRGFEGDGETCTDINECNTDTHNCDQNAFCTNSYGSFECTCGRNFAGNGTYCVPIDQTTCADRPCFPGVECTNTFLGVNQLDLAQVEVLKMYQCGPCPPGYVGDGETCFDVNECLTGQHECHSRANCINTEGSYQCVCQDGYAGDGKTCVRLDARKCIDRPCFTRVECTDVELRDVLRTPNWRTLDVINLFRCGDCPQGYEGDGEVCSNIDECRRGLDNCHRFARCIDNLGSFTCECLNGYAGDGETCIRLDGRACSDRPCFPNVVCQDIPLRRILSSPDWQGLPIIKLYQCGPCPEGYEGNGETCSDANECLTGSHNCHNNARCINARGGHTCQCRDGFIGDGVNNCLPIDPTTCADQPCFDNVRCRPIPLNRDLIDYRTTTLVKQYQCGNCPPGYEGDGDTCRDVNECITGGDDNCHRFAQCVNTVGSYECRCNANYLGDGQICIPIDRTTCTDQPCFQGVRCTTVFPNFADIDPRRTTVIKLYQCGPCPPGYTGDGERCEDVNECLSGDFVCHRNARCVNTIGSYRCDCNEGYVGDGKICVPIDPRTCRDRPCYTSQVHGNVPCTDVPLQQAYNPNRLQFLEIIILFRCGECPAGFQGDGETCEDRDECRLGNDDCHINARCINTEGAYTCECNPGYAGNGRTCTPVDPTTCRDRPCFTGVVCTDIPLSRGDTSLPNSRDIKQYECGPCPPGFFGNDGINCFDENECLRGAHDCHVNATCRNIPGSHVCECNPGHIGNGSFCLNLDPRICANAPCFPGVDCFDIQVNDIDFTLLDSSLSIVKLFECGPCPEDHVGDGELCKKLPPKIVSQQLKVIAYNENTDNDGLVPDVRVRVFVANPTKESGTEPNIFEGAASALTGPNGIATLTVPHNQTIIVQAQKTGYLLNSVTFRPRIDQANTITFEMTEPAEFNEFRWRSIGSRAFEFGDVAAGNLFRIEIPPEGLAVRERSRVRVEFHPINTTIPEALAEAPELIAAVRNSQGRYDLRALETIGMADLIITEVDRRRAPRVVNPFIIEIPIQIERGNIRPGDTMPAWNFDQRKGVWVRKGLGEFRLAEEGYIVWQYIADNLDFTWWAAGRVWEDTSCITVKTCYDPFCFRPAADIVVTLTGVDFRYQATRTTDEDGQICMPFTMGKTARITLPCTEDSHIVQGTRRASKCSAKQTQYDIPKFSSPIAIENNCEEHVFIIPQHIGPECYDPGNVQNGERYGTNYKYGSEVIYSCDEGFTLSEDSSSTRVCTQCGDWTGQIPSCQSGAGGNDAFSSSSSIPFPNY